MTPFVVLFLPACTSATSSSSFTPAFLHLLSILFLLLFFFSVLLSLTSLNSLSLIIDSSIHLYLPVTLPPPVG